MGQPSPLALSPQGEVSCTSTADGQVFRRPMRLALREKPSRLAIRLSVRPGRGLLTRFFVLG